MHKGYEAMTAITLGAVSGPIGMPCGPIYGPMPLAYFTLARS